MARATDQVQESMQPDNRLMEAWAEFDTYVNYFMEEGHKWQRGHHKEGVEHDKGMVRAPAVTGAVPLDGAEQRADEEEARGGHALDQAGQ